MCPTNQALTFIDKEVGCPLCNQDSMVAVVNRLVGGPLKRILLGMPLCSIYRIHLGCSREVMVTMVIYNGTEYVHTYVFTLYQRCIVTTLSTVHRLDNVHNLLASNTRASILKYRNLSHMDARQAYTQV